MLLYVLCIFSVIFSLCLTKKSELPVTPCKRDSNDYSACLRQSVEDAWPQFVAGLPEFDFPPLDPLFYKYGKFVINSGDVHYQVIFSNATIIGLSKIQFLSIRTNFLDDFFYLEVKGNIPKLFVKGDIRADGNLSGFRLANEGYYNVTAEDIRTAANLTGHVVNDTWIVEYIHLVMPIGKFKLYYNDAVNDKKAFVDIIISFVNEFWPMLYRVSLPFMIDGLQPFMVDITNKFFSKISFSTVFP